MVKEAETPILWLPDAKSWLIGKDPDAGKDWGQEEKGTTEDEMVGWHHQHNGHGFGWTLGVGDGQAGLAYCGSWGHKESDTTERLNWTDWICFLCMCLSQEPTGNRWGVICQVLLLPNRMSWIHIFEGLITPNMFIYNKCFYNEISCIQVWPLKDKSQHPILIA